MDIVHNHSSLVHHVPLSESFQAYLHNRYGPGIYPSVRKLEHQ
jgi:hypothetical protein